jgi:Domain of unknown function (DUF5102)
VRVSNDLSQVLLGGRLTWSGSPALERSSQRAHSRQKSSLVSPGDDDPEADMDDDFEDFKEGVQGGEDDDFGDFDDGLERPSVIGDVIEPDPQLPEDPHPTFVSLLRTHSCQSTISFHMQFL